VPRVSSFELPISARPHSSTSGTPLGRLPVKTPTAGDDTEDDNEVAARNTLERRLEWVRRAFDELILPATSVSFLA
jgi:hypothetical protein